MPENQNEGKTVVQVAETVGELFAIVDDSMKVREMLKAIFRIGKGNAASLLATALLVNQAIAETLPESAKKAGVTNFLNDVLFYIDKRQNDDKTCQCIGCKSYRALVQAVQKPKDNPVIDDATLEPMK